MWTIVAADIMLYSSTSLLNSFFFLAQQVYFSAWEDDSDAVSLLKNI